MLGISGVKTGDDDTWLDWEDYVRIPELSSGVLDKNIEIEGCELSSWRWSWSPICAYDSLVRTRSLVGYRFAQPRARAVRNDLQFAALWYNYSRAWRHRLLAVACTPKWSLDARILSWWIRFWSLRKLLCCLLKCWMDSLTRKDQDFADCAICKSRSLRFSENARLSVIYG